MDQRKKLLIVPGNVIYPLSLGSSVAQNGMIDFLRRHFDITLFLGPNNVSEKDLPELADTWPNVRFYKWGYQMQSPRRKSAYLRQWFYRARSRYRKWQDRGKTVQNKDIDNILFNVSLITNLVYPEKATSLARVVREHAFDLIQFDLPENISLVHTVGHLGAKKIFIHHEIKCERIRSHIAARRVPGHYGRYLHGSLQAIEVGHLNAYDALVVLTDADRQRLADRLKVNPPVYTSPFAIPDSLELGVNRTPDEFVVDKIIFLGPYQHFPNYDAVEWLLENVYPKVHPRLKRPWFILGKWNLKDDKVRRWADLPGVTFTGFVDDLTPYFENALMLAPIRIGGGIKTKILQGMLNCLPIIGHGFAFEGIDPVDGESALIRETSEGYVDAVLKSSAEPRWASGIGRRARRLVVDRFSRERVGNIRNRILMHILETNKIGNR
jgi:glycosyltransferase involved in cell wall biosynthesis